MSLRSATRWCWTAAGSSVIPVDDGLYAGFDEYATAVDVADLLGDPQTVFEATGGQLAAYGADPSAVPVYGTDLYATSAAVAARFFAGPPPSSAAPSLWATTCFQISRRR